MNRPDPAVDWPTLGALNATSMLAQVGQYGIAFVVLPVWLAQQGLPVGQLSVFAAALWLGQLTGLLGAPALLRATGARSTIMLGLLCSVLGLALVALSAQAPWPACLGGGLLAGLGLGLRWIGLEPWLYHIAPTQARGRVVGFHETLIALAPIGAPMLAQAWAIQTEPVFALGLGFTLAALLPLALTRPPPAGLLSPGRTATPHRIGWSAWRGDPVLRLGLLMALAGGLLDAAVAGLFAPYAQDHQLSALQTAELLAVFGLGGLVCQYGVGWLSDHRGVSSAARVCTLGTLLSSLVLLGPLPYAALAGAVFVLGGCLTAYLTLALVAATAAPGEQVTERVRAISLLYTASGFAGPLLAGWGMQASQGNALMVFTALGALLLLALLRR